MNDGGVCRTAPATPGLLNISNPLLDQFKDGAIFQAWFKNKIPNLSQGQQLRSGVVEKLIFQ